MNESDDVGRWLLLFWLKVVVMITALAIPFGVLLAVLWHNA